MDEVVNRVDKSDRVKIVADVPEQESGGLRVTMAGRNLTGRTQCPARSLARECILIYTESGAGTVKVGSRWSPVAPGDGFLLGSGVPHQYYTPGDAWHISWFHCTGGPYEDLLVQGDRARWIPPTPCGAASPLPGLIRAILREFEQGAPYFDLAAASLAQTAIVELARARDAARTGPARESGLDELDTISRYIKEHLDRPVGVSELARLMHVSPRHLRRLCRRFIGQTPQQYVLRLKLAEAKRLLLTTDLSISAIGARVGMYDSHYFSRLFRRKTGRSPSEFRQQALM